MHIPNGDPLLVHLMMLHEVRSQEVIDLGNFEFEVQGYRMMFTEQDYCLITGLRFGPFLDLINEGTKHQSKLRARLFPEESDESLRLKQIEDFILSPNFRTVNDADGVKLVESIFLLKGLIGRDPKTCIPPLVYKLLDDQYDWERYYYF